MWAVKLQQMQDGRLYIAGIGAGIENTPDGMQSQVLLAADRIAMINPANGNTKPMFVGQGDQIFMNEVFLKTPDGPTITSGGNPPAFSLTPDGGLTAKNADISGGNVNANSGRSTTIHELTRTGHAGRRPRTRLKALKLYQKPSRKKSVRGVTRKHQTVRLQSPSAMIITLTARLLFRRWHFQRVNMTIRGAY